MIIIEKIIPYRYGQTIKIKPVFDVHFGNKNCNAYKLKEYLKDSDDLTYFIGGGDLCDSIVIQDKRYSKNMDITETEAIIDDSIDGLIEIFNPYKEKFIGIGRGNHEDTVLSKCGTDITKRICRRLSTEEHQIPHLGYSGLIKLILRDTAGKRNRVIIIRWHHGWGGSSARTLGGTINKYSKDIPFWDADIYLYGHDHQCKGDKILCNGLSGTKMIDKRKIIALCGSYLKTVHQGTDVSYSEKSGYPPVETGGLVVKIKPHRRGRKLWFEDRND